MAGDWLKIELELPDKPEIFSIATRLNLDPDAVVGKLIRVWQWFDKHTTDGNAHGVTFQLLDRISGVSGFGEAMSFAKWIEQKGTVLTMPKFDRHTSESAKTRAQAQKRVAKHRNAVCVTKLLPEKRERGISTSQTEAEFSMQVGWQPSSHLLYMAKQAGVQITPAIQQEFIAFWLTRPNTKRTQGEWDKALLQSAMHDKAHATSRPAKKLTAENLAERNYGEEVTTL